MALKNKAVCVHGHFYQPPRENPWSGQVEPEESAFPYRDWNSRITAECYGPLASEYGRISFNFGPTLLRWLEAEQPSLYKRILAAGGNAMAHPYVHAILPLCTERDQRTLIRWGLDDFEARFKHKAEGLWLPETAVSSSVLEAAAAEGARFVVLSPHQAARVRSPGGDWKDVTRETLDPTRPYSWKGRLAVFFYHDLLSRGVETGESIADGETLARKVLARFLPDDSHQLVHLASDGEFYGHHIKHGAKALSRALDILAVEGVELTTYGAYLRRFPPPQEVEIVEETSWSCPHGLERWKSDCGCRSKSHPDWKQDWRAPLRGALERLAGDLDAFYETEMGKLLSDPWEARDEYRKLLADPSSADFFLAERAARELDFSDQARALELLKMQRQRLEMLTSCGWFFDDVSGLETTQILKHAARAIDHARDLGFDPTDSFVDRLSRAPSNVRRFGDGAGVYRKLVLPCRFDDARATARRSILETLGLWDSVEPLPGFDDKLPCQARRGERLDVEATVNERTFGIDALLPEERKHVMRLLMPDPAGSEALRQWLLRWAGQIAKLRRGERDGEEELLKMLEEKRLPVSQLPWLDATRTHLERLLETLVDDDDPKALARAMRWVEAFENSGAPFELWKLRQFTKRWQDSLKSRGCPSPSWEAATALEQAVKL
jgi:hypothetical protein